MKENIWFDIKTDKGLEFKPTSGHGVMTMPPINMKQATVIYTYAKRHNVVRIQFAPDAIRMEHADGLVERFLKFEDLEKEVGKLVQAEQPYQVKDVQDQRKPKPVTNWRKTSDVATIIRLFPKKPTADDILDLFLINKELRSNKLENYILQVSSKL
jgi:hypothetical protein